MSLHVKFQPSSFKTVGVDSCNRHTHRRWALSDENPIEISKLAPRFAWERLFEGLKI